MSHISFFFIFFFGYFLITITSYAIIISFGKKAKDLRDPFEEHKK